MTIGFLFNPYAWWIGLHYSNECKRLCVNLVPWFTLFVVFKRGKFPKRGRKICDIN